MIESRTPVSSAEISERVFQVVARAASRPDVKAAVERNHDNNQWWPTDVQDWKLRMVVAGWSTRVSYSMVGAYAGVVRRVAELGYDRLVQLSDPQLQDLVRPIGLHDARVKYLRSLADYLDGRKGPSQGARKDELAAEIEDLQSQVAYAGYKVAQCAALYAHGYHCGIIPVDSGMVVKLAPVLGIDVGRGAKAHEAMRLILEEAVNHRAQDFEDLINLYGYRVHVPTDALPTWWVHLVLIYFKRLYLNEESDRLCLHRPVCDRLLDCYCTVDRMIDTDIVMRG